MNQLALMNSLPIERKQYNGQMVVTFRDIDAIHQRPEGSARKRFKDNKKHFIEGIDYFRLSSNQLSEIRTVGITSNNGGILLTQTGYLMIVKSFTDELSWAIQRELVTGYFARQKPPLSFMGTAVIPLKDAAAALGRSVDAIRHMLARNSDGLFTMGDCLLLEGSNLKRYKEENGLHKMPGVTALWVISAAGYEKLRKIFE